MKDFCVLLDNGHGRETKGKRSPVWSDGSQVLEWELNRRIVHEIDSRLKKLGIKSVILVPEDKDIDLSVRAERANKYTTDYKCIFISVHCDAFDVINKATGWTVFSTTKKNLSDSLADQFIKNFPDIFPDMYLRGHKEKNYTIIYKTNCPSVLTENFFMTTETPDCRLLMSEDGIAKIAELHVKSILNFQKEQYPETIKETHIPYPLRDPSDQQSIPESIYDVIKRAYQSELTRQKSETNQANNLL